MAQPDKFQVPTHLLQPLWLRSQESLSKEGLVYDPIAAKACMSCQLSPDCVTGDIKQKQLLHATLTQLCDQQVSRFLAQHPSAWVINVGAGLDTRFYRLDNGRCRWIELDVTENLVWRQQLFHRNERYKHSCGSVKSLGWLDTLEVSEEAPVLILCEMALLDCKEREVADFVQSLAKRFVSAQVCMVVAGDHCSSKLGQRMGSAQYQHGFSNPQEKALQWLPWAKSVNILAPFDYVCPRWKGWQRWLSKIPAWKYRLTPSLVTITW